jgi:hypothetical protein
MLKKIMVLSALGLVSCLLIAAVVCPPTPEPTPVVPPTQEEPTPSSPPPEASETPAPTTAVPNTATPVPTNTPEQPTLTPSVVVYTATPTATLQPGVTPTKQKNPPKPTATWDCTKNYDNVHCLPDTGPMDTIAEINRLRRAFTNSMLGAAFFAFILVSCIIYRIFGKR